ncbi:MAG: TonB-dependent siderophore receptor [Gammaproteobacteria bacterium]
MLPEVVIVAERGAVPAAPAAQLVSIDADEMRSRGIRSSTEALRFDASVNESYNAVGYAEQFSLRGFTLDANSSYRKDGFAISADTQIPLENKERIEIVKGLGGVEAGIAAPGGVIDYVLKRPTDAPLRAVTLEARERGTLYGAVDIGGRFADGRFGYRINAANERIRSYVRGANGSREFVAAAFDWRIGARTLLELDADYQHKSQISNTGYQLTAGTALPERVDPSFLVNDQPWVKPTDTRSSNVGLRLHYRLDNGWQATLAANRHRFERDDFVIFPYGCSSEGAGFYPGYCVNGDYDAYDYRSEGEKKNPLGLRAQLAGRSMVGGVAHALSFTLERSTRTDWFGDYVYEYIGAGNIYRHNVLAPADKATRNIRARRHERETALALQDSIEVGGATRLDLGVRRVRVERDAGFQAGFSLPSAAVVHTLADGATVYASAALGLEHGGVAPFLTQNEYATLSPSRTRQVEVGGRGKWAGVNFSAALFQIAQALEYTDAANVYVSHGRRTHRGVELTARGGSAALRWSTSLMGLRSRQSGTGQAALDGKHVANVPALKASSTATYTLGDWQLDGEWTYSAKKSFNVENTVDVPGYHVFGVGAARSWGGLTVRANVDNIADKFYWRDATPLAGGYLFPGAPRTFRVSAQFGF